MATLDYEDPTRPVHVMTVKNVEIKTRGGLKRGSVEMHDKDGHVICTAVENVAAVVIGEDAP